MHAGDGRAQLRAGEDAEATLAAADAIRTADHPAFLAALARLDRAREQLPPGARMHLDYLDAWQTAYAGDHAKATPMLEAVIDHSTDKVLRVRATATLVNLLGAGRHYQEAFVRLDDLIAALPGIDNAQARFQAMAEASQLMTAAGQYDLAATYAERAAEVANTPHDRVQEQCRRPSCALPCGQDRSRRRALRAMGGGMPAVSYTHLTLPTKLL